MKWPLRRRRAGVPAPEGAAGAAGVDFSGEVAHALAGVRADASAEALRDGTPAGLLPPEAFLPLDQVEAVRGLHNIPYLPGVFVGREREVALVEEALGADGGRVVVHAVHGLGGIGKSTLAAYVAAHHAADERVVWWIPAQTPEAVDAGLADFARALQPALAELPAETLRERALEWFRTHTGWLIVLDDADSPDHLREFLAQLPASGRVLVTSRRAFGWRGLATSLAIDVLDEEAAVELFGRILGGEEQTVEVDSVRDLCRELGHLPLAIEQAAAYCREACLEPGQYLEMLHQYTGDILDAAVEGQDPGRTIARVWRLSLDRLAPVPLAVDIFRILAWYAPTDIPRALLDGLGRRTEVARALVELARHSVILIAGDSIAVHPLVQATARTSDASDPHRDPDLIRTAHGRAVDLLLASLADAPTTGPESARWWRALAPHVNQLDARTPRDWSSMAMAVLRGRTGDFLHGQGSVRQAVILFEHAVDDVMAALGSDHPDTLVLTNNLAGACASAGQVHRAVELYERALEGQSRSLGLEHPQTLVTWANLALAYQSLGDVARAMESYERILDLQLRVLGDDHPHTLVTRHNLAAAYAEAGDFDRSVATFRQVLADQVRVLGAHHLQTLGTENNLAAALAEAGDLEGARERYVHLLEDLSRVLGETHPDTITTRGNLAYVTFLGGDVEEARRLFEEVLEAQRGVLGDDDLRTLATLDSLALVYSETEPDRSIAVLERVAAERSRLLGEDHPHTLTSYASLAYVLLSVGDRARAMSLLERTATERAFVLGEDHPDTLGSQLYLGEALRAEGRLDRAEAVLARAAEVSTRALGSAHALTESLHNALNGVRGDR
ncbi:tetratricopeptide repeat protein [Streptomyces sp. NPDC050803]|uniref:tetratricopeptide repeat protein n=1 Tax=unclassified Streptomyces TaxID=2593676 RepID=UPI0034203510